MVIVSVLYFNQKIDSTTTSQLRVGTTYMTMNNPFYEVINSEIEKTVTEYGGKVVTRDPVLNSQKQVEQIEYFIATGVDVIVLNPVKSDDKEILEAVERAELSGIHVIVIDSQLYSKVKVTATTVNFPPLSRSLINNVDPAQSTSNTSPGFLRIGIVALCFFAYFP